MVKHFFKFITLLKYYFLLVADLNKCLGTITFSILAQPFYKLDIDLTNKFHSHLSCNEIFLFIVIICYVIEVIVWSGLTKLCSITIMYEFESNTKKKCTVMLHNILICSSQKYFFFKKFEL